MKILFLSCWYPTEKNPNFGIFVKEHAHAIHLTDNEIVTLSIVIHRDKKIFDTTISDFLDEKGMRTVLIEINTRFRDLLYHLIPLQYLIIKSVFKKRIRKYFEPDIIHSNVIFPAGIIGHWLSMFLKKPHVITEHWSRIKGFLSKPVLGKWAVNAYQHADAILPVSGFLKNNIISLLPDINQSKIHIVGNVVNADIFTYKEKNPDPGTIKFCAIATWANKKLPDKLPELFINALAGYQKESDKKIILTMIGGGNKVEDLKRMCQDLNIKTHFTGYIDKKEITEYLHQSDFLLHASTVETFGVGIVEALMTGTPVICSKVGALPEIVFPEYGILTENTFEVWVDSINIATQTSFNHKKIATKNSDRFSPSKIGNCLQTIYNNLIPVFEI